MGGHRKQARAYLVLVADRWRNDDPREIRMRASWNIPESRKLMLCISRSKLLVQQNKKIGLFIFTGLTRSFPLAKKSNCDLFERP